MAKAVVTGDVLADLQAGRFNVPGQEELVETGFLVASREGERQEVLASFERMNQLNNELLLTVVLNFDCNFSCIYCYEGEQKGQLAQQWKGTCKVCPFAPLHSSKYRKHYSQSSAQQ